MGSDVRRADKNDVFLDLSDQFGKDWKTIGRRLGLSEPMLQNIEVDHHCQRERGHQVLIKWEQTTGEVNAVERLDDALRKAQRVDLVDTYIPRFKSVYEISQSANPTMMCTSQGSTPRGDDVVMVAQMSKELRYVYSKRSKVPMIPWAEKGGKIVTEELERVYTNLELLVDIDSPYLPIRYPLQGPEQLFSEIKTASKCGGPEMNGGNCQMDGMEDDDGEEEWKKTYYKRVVARGRTGSGKTTFLLKLSYDWANGKGGPLKGAKAVFLLPLKKLDHRSNLGEAIVEHFFPKKNFTPQFVEEFIQKNQKYVAVLLDGYDEFKGKGLLQGESGNIVKMMRNEYLPDVRLLVTTRPGRVVDFMELGDDITDEYRHLEITGFSSSDIDKYVEKIFQTSTDLAKKLLNYLAENNLKTELASLPLMCCAFCQLTKLTDGKDFKDMNTISTLFDKLVKCLLKYHPRSKEQRQRETPTLETSTAPSEVLPERGNLDQEPSGSSRVYASDDLIRALGKVALMGFTRSQEEELIFCNRDFLGCGVEPQHISQACKAGILIRDGEAEYRPTRYEDLDINQNEGEDFDVRNITFVLKIFQEKLAGMHLGHLSNGTPEERDQFLAHVQGLTSLQRAMDLGNVLMFACGTSITAARSIIGRVVELLLVETSNIVLFMKGKLHYSECSKIQRQIEFCLQLNYESQCKGSLNDVLKPILCGCTQLRLVGISSYVTKSLGYFLEHSQCGDGIPVRSLELVRLYLNSSSEFREFLNTFPGLEEEVTNSMAKTRRKKKRANEMPLTEERRREKLRKVVEAGKQIPKYLLQRTDDTFLAVLPLWDEVSKMQMSEWNFGPVIEGMRRCSIETLTLNGVKAEHERDWESLFRMLSNPASASLQKLTLSMTDIKEDCLAKLVPALSAQTNIRYLKLSGNEIGEPFLDALGKYPPMVNLDTLILEKTDMDSESIEQLGDLLGKFPGLTTLDIRRNEGSDDTAIISILDNLHHCKNLGCLMMSLHGVTEKGLARLLEKGDILSQLEELHLVHTPRPNDVIKYVASILPSMSQLQDLRISATPPDKTKQQMSAGQVDHDVAFRFSEALTRTLARSKLRFLSILYVTFGAESFIHLLQRCTEAKEAAALATLRFSSSCIPADDEVRKPVRDAKESGLLRIWV